MRSIERLGDTALRWALPADAEPRALLAALLATAGVIDAVVTESHACVYYEPDHPPDLSILVPSWRAIPAPRSVVIRTRYDGRDLTELAERSDMTTEELISLFEEREYTVRMMGFLPGFAYLREVHPRILAPRRAQPRTKIPAGAVATAAGYAGVYPFASPGGWNLLGTAVDFRPFSDEGKAAFAVGDRVRFERVP